MIKNYLKIAIRHLFREKVFSLINITGLAIGFISFLFIFQYISFEKSYDKFHENIDNIYRVRNDRIYSDIHDKSAACPPAVGPTLKKEFPEILKTSRIHDIGWANTTITTIVEGKNKINNSKRSFNQEKVFFAEPSFLEIFSFPMLRTSSKHLLVDPNTAVISETSAKKYFGKENPLGRQILVSHGNYGKHIFKITGVFKDVPANSHIEFEFLLSYKTLVNISKKAEYTWGWNAFNTYLLLSPRTNPQFIEAKLTAMIKKYDDPAEDYTRRLLLQPVKDIHLNSNLRMEVGKTGDANAVHFLMLIAIFIIFIAWINYINLSTAQSSARAKEVGIRKVLGSQRRQLMVQFIFESAIINTIAFIIAIALIFILQPFFNQLTNRVLSVSILNNLWPKLALFITSGVIFSSIYTGLVLSSYNPLKVIKKLYHKSRKGLYFRNILVVTQFSISIIMIISTFIVLNQIDFINNRDLGFNSKQNLVVTIPAVKGDINKLRTELLRYPSIKSVTFSSRVPGKGYSNASSGIRRKSSNLNEGKRCFFIDVDHNYFKHYGIEFISGNAFPEQFMNNKTVIINEETVNVLGFKSAQEALNKKIVLGGLEGQSVQIAGIIKNYHHKSLKNPIEPIIFNPKKYGKYISIKIIKQNINQTVKFVGGTLHEVFPDQPFDYFFLDELFNNKYNLEQQLSKIFGLFSIFAIFVSCLGLYGLGLFSAVQRTKEIGVRKVLGAGVSSIVSMLSKDFIKWVLISNIIACPIAWYAMNRWLQGFAFHIDITILPFILSGILALIIALLTVIFQAIKAATANPVDSLSYE